MNDQPMTRRGFTARAARTALAAATLPALARRLAAQNPDKIKIGVVGCGGRGTGAAMDAVLSAPNVEIVALADMFPEKIEAALKRLRGLQKEQTREFASQYGNLIIEWNRGDAVKVTPDRCFTGFDAHKQILQTDADIIILGGPPGFRPQQIRAVIEARKHVFAEKPVAVDPVGARSVFQSAELAGRKKLGFMGGTQLRFSQPYNEIIKRIHDGQIGQITSAECYWWHDYFVRWHVEPRKPEWSDMEFQVRCWPQFVWLSGDHIVENLVHNIDVMNWVMGGPPKSAAALGGHSNWDDWPVKGNVYDHFYVEYEYPNGVKAHASSRQIKNCSHRVGERIVGATGIANPYGRILGEKPYDYPGPFDNPRFIQWRAFIESIRKGSPLNYGKQVAEASMTAILGRMSAYTGRTIS
ncbi:MAG: Gfo/Idh/MocA family oxidoreductase, partial [Verrucomicrobia bacterium]|nr:Gfo/Idh/MocA family oxidoreductase [Verrucomicrobiota bacterium]